MCMQAAVRAADYSHKLAGPHKITAPQNLSPTESLWQYYSTFQINPDTLSRYRLYPIKVQDTVACLSSLPV